MLTNLHGRVEMDPMRVPTAAAMTTGRGNAFESVLQEAVDAQVPQEQCGDAAAAPEEPQAAEAVAVEDQAAESQPEPDDLPAGGDDAAPDAEPRASTHGHGPSADVPGSIQRAEPEKAAGPRSDQARPAATSAEPLLAAVIAQGAQPTHGATAAGAQAAVSGVTAAKAGEAPARGVGNGWQRPSSPTSAAAVAAGYRTQNVASAQLLEQARDSVFKQILVKLTDGGGEMRVRLDPPDLGELHLRLVVEGGNKLSLSIAAERADLTQLIQRHLDELKQTLQSAGLEVTEAHVETRGDRSNDQRRRERDDGNAHESHGDSPSAFQPTRRGGYVSAEGLDFWV